MKLLKFSVLFGLLISTQGEAATSESRNSNPPIDPYHYCVLASKPNGKTCTYVCYDYNPVFSDGTPSITTQTYQNGEGNCQLFRTFVPSWYQPDLTQPVE